MSSLEKLKKTTSLSDIATLIGYKPKALSYILYILPDNEKYIEFTIPKKTGGVRKIKAPTPQLRKLQKHLASFLNRCYEEIFSKKIKLDSLSHGFRKKHSITTNAAKHKKRRHVFNIDLQDFFPSINFGRVRGFFIKNAHFQLHPKVATVIAQIACHDNELPQGSPCSPVISNLIGHLLDIRMVNLAKRAKCTYTRYADDLTFSTNKKEFPAIISVKCDNSDNQWAPSKELKKEIERVDFKINEQKTPMTNKTRRQIVTGLVVNNKTNTKNDYYKNARSMCHSLFKTGQFYINNKCVYSSEITVKPEVDIYNTNNTSAEAADNTKSSQVIINIQGSVNQLEGILSFIHQIKGPHDGRKINNKKNKPSAATKLCREFLFYKHFFSLNQPLIICEGKTDVIYLKCALTQLINEYGMLAQKIGDTVTFSINFLKLSNNLKSIFAISDGTPGLASIMDIYKEHMKPFMGDGKKHPVIILIDNDAGSDEIKKKLKISGTVGQFYHFKENLYVVFISKIPGGDQAAIEDLFDTELLKTNIGGKTFNKSDKFDTKKEYGKSVFASKVVKHNQKNINFDGFKETFNRFQAVITDYTDKLSKLSQPPSHQSMNH